MTVVCWSVKGGSGTTVVSSSLARVFADRYGAALLVDVGGDGIIALGGSEQPKRGVQTWLSANDDVSSESLDLLAIDLGRNLRILPSGPSIDGGGVRSARWNELASYLQGQHDPVVVDLGVIPQSPNAGLQEFVNEAETSLLVLRSCYLAVRRAIDFPLRPTGIVLVRDPDRMLSANDVAAAIGVPVVATIFVDPRIGKSVDTGQLGDRIPRPLVRSLRRIAA
jgi:hypothetical protein